jgi:predicted dienelactone hydrolase
MRVHPGTALCSAFLLLFAALSAAETPPVYFSVPPADAPELAKRGPYAVGVRTLSVTNPGQPDILNFSKETGKAPLYDRPLTLEVWYPAALAAGQEERTDYEMVLAGPAPKTFHIAGKAARDATPAKGGPFPLVIVSHGYPGSRVFLSYLTENLASKGYVVAAIDHTDSVLGAVKPFPSTLLNRSKDQWFAIDTLSAMAAKGDSFLAGLADPSRVAVIGYSMGGYGALTTAGAGYSKTGLPAKLIPGGYLNELMAGEAAYEGKDKKNLKAVVAIAPWGAQPPYKSWDAAGLAGIHIPSLFIAGDQDDISDYGQGIQKAFEGATNSDRCLLVYENARHNVGGNPAPPEALGSMTTREFFDEPVWRKDRISAINQHFITVFLDLYLKGDESRRSFLQVKPEKSNDSKWPVSAGEVTGERYSGGVEKNGSLYWKGFQRRWALGLEMHCSEGKK